ncbi:hypothetical protein GZL_00292 [Streptomyces sp. 769]|nr:hypothetical protein GZL_00292 [Streptomyces sp. 769]
MAQFVKQWTIAMSMPCCCRRDANGWPGSTLADIGRGENLGAAIVIRAALPDHATAAAEWTDEGLSQPPVHRRPAAPIFVPQDCRP